MPNQFQEITTHNGFDVMLQAHRPERIVEVSPGRWRMEIQQGDFYSDSDRDNGRTRTEMRLRSTLKIGAWNTFSYTVERPPEEFPVWGSERADKITTGQLFYDGSDPRPSYWLETLGGQHSVFWNSYVSGGPKGAEPLSPASPVQRVCHEVRPYADGTLDVRIHINGSLWIVSTSVPCERAFTRDLFFKLGLYMSRGKGRLNEPMPTFTAYFSDIRFHEGEATAEDLAGPAVQVDPAPVPDDPTPEPEPEPPPQPTAGIMERVEALDDELQLLGRQFRDHYPAEVDDVATIRRQVQDLRSKMRRVDRDRARGKA